MAEYASRVSSGVEKERSRDRLRLPERSGESSDLTWGEVGKNGREKEDEVGEVGEAYSEAGVHDPPLVEESEWKTLLVSLMVRNLGAGNVSKLTTASSKDLTPLALMAASCFSRRSEPVAVSSVQLDK